ncbi:hypothetical protein HQ332_10950 [Rhodococcus sp. BP-359]|uniref:hypothetical protein n=1 Tax=unclassified Rhodococcus (in: high G+C Gram-positive bacteria) TaxID=192944 RepID=UPI001C9AA0FB|nr:MULTISPECIES: hypothetical protein [unclassified Rhodococcus (in: high G+C Gram-positive bacteria)]MBY6603699.1 hypothetical protein [Rhodococcus sp. BP-351]MBY6689959.1 hypothetical protein [Rhodococcus sp. BP-331]MBY6544483.1 hypothetical protein [Rhodococcus sp. BP-369]MBY6563713.1 hypothetical protein [Rhodococcus sp. BP-370]MBY6578005.1 hypothetical protein [Rhodococcus sp. BP-364]
MTDRDPLTPDLLADLHAGVLPDDEAARVRARADIDVEAAAYLADLDAVVEMVGARGADLTAGFPMPPSVAARLQEALADAPRDEVATRRAGRRARMPVVAAAAAITVLVGAAAALSLASIESSGDADDVVASDRLLDDRTVLSFVGSVDRGRFTDATVLAGCLEANGIPASATVVGSGPVTLDGTEATLLVTAGTTPGSLVAIAVGDACGPDDPDTVSRAEIG